LEAHGIPAVCITALPRLAASAGATRMVQGIKIPYPCGQDAAGGARRSVRGAVVAAALATLGRDIEEPLVIDPCAAW
jgi:hypothetical protein